MEINYTGGPLDGQWRDMPSGQDGNPPLTFEINGLPKLDLASTEDDDSPIVLRVGVYEREVSPRDDGALWLYRWRGWTDEQAS